MPPSPVVLAIHGGAGVDPAHDYSLPEAFMAEALARARPALEAGGHALDLVTDIVTEMEASGLFIAGKGSSPNQVGEVELDACVMNGEDATTGAVALITSICTLRDVRDVVPHAPKSMRMEEFFLALTLPGE